MKYRFEKWEDAVSWLKQQKNERQLVLDCYYDDPLIKAAERYWNSDEWSAIQKKFKGRSGRALDVGAGRGIASYALARDGFSVVALEPDPSTLVGAGAINSLAQDTGLPIRVVQEFSEKLPFSDNEFDLVFVRAALHHTQNLDLVCHELARVLKPGGLMLVIREHVVSREVDLSRFLDRHPLHKLYGGENAYQIERYLESFKRSGLRVLEILSPWHSVINFAPHSLKSLKGELAQRMGNNILVLGLIFKFLFKFQAVWILLRYVLEKLDNRPGRLYSFIMEKA